MSRYCIVRDGRVHEARILDTQFGGTVETEIRDWIHREPHSEFFEVTALDEASRRVAKAKFSLEEAP